MAQSAESTVGTTVSIAIDLTLTAVLVFVLKSLGFTPLDAVAFAFVLIGADLAAEVAEDSEAARGVVIGQQVMSVVARATVLFALAAHAFGGAS